MSFFTDSRKVRSNDLPSSRRLCAFRSCVGHFHWLTRQGFNSVLGRYEREFDLDVNAENFNERVVQAINSLEIERRLFLEKLNAFERKRIREKMLGKRSPSKKSVEEIFGAKN